MNKPIKYYHNSIVYVKTLRNNDFSCNCCDLNINGFVYLILMMLMWCVEWIIFIKKILHKQEKKNLLKN